MQLVIDANILIAAFLKSSVTDDAPYLALSVALGIPVWSNDAVFKEQRLASVYTTPELIKIINKE